MLALPNVAKGLLGLLFRVHRAEVSLGLPLPIPKWGRLQNRIGLRIGPREMVENFGIAVVQGKGGGQMELDFGFEFTHSPGDFQDTVLYGIKLLIHPGSALQSLVSQTVQ